jgi:transcriptional regulator with XRE-family HTH domain
MTDQKVGRVVRALRRRLGWRQLDLGRKADCSQSMISLVERGHLDRVSLRAVRRILGALDASAMLAIEWRAGALERLLDEDHATVEGIVAEVLRRGGWTVMTEVTYSHFGERGSYDILAYHPGAKALLVVEVKTDLPSIEATNRKLDEKARLAPIIALQRFEWKATGASRLLVMPDDRTLRRRVARHARLMDAALPARSVEVRRWLAAPADPLAGIWFMSVTNARGAIQTLGGRHRVRRPRNPSANDDIAA